MPSLSYYGSTKPYNLCRTISIVGRRTLYYKQLQTTTGDYIPDIREWEQMGIHYKRYYYYYNYYTTTITLHTRYTTCTSSS